MSEIINSNEIICGEGRVELPYRKKFMELPAIEMREILDYFNLELSPQEANLDESCFEYSGVYEVDGYERMCWKVRGKDLYAVVRPFEDSYIIEMDSMPDNAVKVS